MGELEAHVGVDFGLYNSQDLLHAQVPITHSRKGQNQWTVKIDFLLKLLTVSVFTLERENSRWFLRITLHYETVEGLWSLDLRCLTVKEDTSIQKYKVGPAVQCFTWLKEVLNQFCILWVNQCWSANPDVMCDHRVLVKKLSDHSLDQLEPKQRRSYSVWWTPNSIYQDKRRKYINVFLLILERLWAFCHYRLFLAKLYFKTNLWLKLKLDCEFGWLMVDKLLKRDLPTYRSIPI